MLQTSVLWLRVAAALYAVGLLHVLLLVLRRSSTLFSVALASFCVAAVLQTVSITELSMALGTFPASNFYETISLCALLIAGLFLFVYWRYQFTSLSVFLFPSVFIMTLIGATEFPVASWSNRAVRNAWLVLHIICALIGYAALALTAVVSVFYLLQERHLKTKTTSQFFRRLPPLGTMDELVSRFMSWGFVFITLATVAGSIWAFIESGTRWVMSGSVLIAFLTWAFYLVMVFMRYSAGWRGRKAALLTLVVVGCCCITWFAHIGLGPILAQ